MNDEHFCCATWAEPISLLAAGGLSVEEELEVQQHVAGCAACRQRLDELTTLCASLPAASSLTELAPTETVSRAMREIVNGKNSLLRPTAPIGWHVAALRFTAAVGLTAACVLIGIAIRPLATSGTHDSAASGDQPSTTVNSLPPVTPPTAVREIVRRDVAAPTWLELQRALAESDEAFDTLLARNGESLRFTPLDTRTLLQESTP